MTGSTATRTTAALQARRTATAAMLDRVQDAVTQLKRERAKVSFAAVARRADVSRTYHYRNTKACNIIRQAADTTTNARVHDGIHRAAQIEDSWRERALNAESELTAAYNEINGHRNTIAELLGRIRDIDAILPEDGIQHLISDNNTLKAKLRQLANENHLLKERLQGARDNNRFLDNRVRNLRRSSPTASPPHSTPPIHLCRRSAPTTFIATDSGCEKE